MSYSGQNTLKIRKKVLETQVSLSRHDGIIIVRQSQLYTLGMSLAKNEERTFWEKLSIVLDNNDSLLLEVQRVFFFSPFFSVMIALRLLHCSVIVQLSKVLMRKTKTGTRLMEVQATRDQSTLKLTKKTNSTCSLQM